MTKVGILVECGVDGMEDHLCRRIVELLAEQAGVAEKAGAALLATRARKDSGWATAGQPCRRACFTCLR